METYEITFITHAEEETGGVSDAIVQASGRIVSQSAPLRRKLAYPIKKETTGVYHTYLFEMAPTNIRELNAKLSRSEGILRHLIIAGGIRKPLEQPAKLKNLEVPASVTKGLTAEETAEKPMVAPADTPAAESPALPTPTETAAATPAPADKAGATAEELTAEERQKKLDEKLKSILGE